MTDALSLPRFHEVIERTVAAGPARITLHLDYSGQRAKIKAARRRGILPLLAKGMARLLVPRNLDAQGFLDLAGRRAMYDQGHWAMLQLDDRVWSGRPGRTLDSLGAGEPPRFFAPLWLFDKLTEVTALEDHGIDEDPTRPWRHITARTTENDGDETVEVWLDDTHIRRFRIMRDVLGIMTFDEFGIDVEELDWTRLPSYQADAKN